MAFATETFGNINSRSGHAQRRKQSRGISPGTVITGVAVVAFAWVAATLITTQSMVLSLPRTEMSAEDFLTPRASAFIVPQGYQVHTARLASQTSPLTARSYAGSVPKDAPVAGAGYTPTRDIVVQPQTSHANAVRAQLASALAQQASELQRARMATASVKGSRPVIAASPAAVAHLRKVIALNFASFVQSMAQYRYQVAAMPVATQVAAVAQPNEIASTVAAAVDAASLPTRDADLPVTDNLATVVPLARPDHVIETAPAVADTSGKAHDDRVDMSPVVLPNEVETASLPTNDADLPVAEDLPSVVPLARPAHIIDRVPAAFTGTPAKSRDDDKADAPPARLLAYAKPDDSAASRPRPFLNPFAATGTRGSTAIYDISAKTVYLPSGERLEAHSGLGYMRDNPRYVDRKNTGPTPPETYDLTYRESLFHGVQALRLTPANGARLYGRDGLLAHTYMLRGSRGDSNGCVVFKDYGRFLAAFRRGEIKRLQVVARLSSSPGDIASR